MSPHLKQFLAGGTLTGAVTGLFVGAASFGDELSGAGAVFAFLVVPGITAAVLTGIFRNEKNRAKRLLSPRWLFARLLCVAYLTTFPVFGVLAGGATVPQVVLVGAISGTFWAMPFMLPFVSR